MKKIIVLLMAAVMIVSCFSVSSVAVSDDDLPTLIYEPMTCTVRTGKSAVLSVTAEGKDLVFSWLMQTSEGGEDRTFDFSKDAGVKGFEALDGTGKMKVTFKTETLENNRVKHQLIIDNIREFNYGAVATCTVANKAGAKNCDPATIYTAVNAPEQLTVELIAEFSVRRFKLVKLVANTYVPEASGYTDDDIEYNWYKTPDGTKESGVALDEHGPVLMADAYATSPGPHSFYCQIYVKYGVTDFYYETGVTHMRVYDPQTIISFDQNEVRVFEDEDVTINMNVKIDPEKDTGELSYQWYKGGNPADINIKIPGENGKSITLNGNNTPRIEYYTCVVTNKTSDDFEFDNSIDDKPYVKVIFTGVKPVKIVKEPFNTIAKAGDEVKFSVQAENAASYLWYLVPADGGIPVPLDSASGITVSGATTDTLTVTAIPGLDGGAFYCRIASPDGWEFRTRNALLTVEDVQKAEIPTILGFVPDSYTVHKDEDFTITVNAEVNDGGTIHYQWALCDEKGNFISNVENNDKNTFSPDTSKTGVIYCLCSVRNTVDGKHDSDVRLLGPLKVEILEAIPDESGVQSTAADTAPGTQGEKTGKTGPGVLVIALVAVISVLLLALAGIGIFVLAKTGKKKEKKVK